MQKETIRLLLIEDDPADADFIQYLLAEAVRVSFEVMWCERLAPGLEALAEGGTDGVLLDLSLPDSHGLQTLAAVLEQAPELPVVVLTGLDDESLALKALQTGAQDYMVKGRMGPDKLVRAVRYALERKKLLLRLEAALDRVRSLSRLIPICSACKKIRDDEGYWQQVEDYMREHSHWNFTHSVCPACARHLYPELVAGILTAPEVDNE